MDRAKVGYQLASFVFSVDLDVEHYTRVEQI